MRPIEIGWIHKNASGSVHLVRQKKGGGIRPVIVKKDARKEDLIEEGKKLFFPNGESSKGKIDNFKFDLLDIQDKSFPNDKNVGDMYEETKLPLLRFYFATVDKCPVEQETCNMESSDKASAAVFNTGLLSTASDFPIISVQGRHVAVVNAESHTTTSDKELSLLGIRPGSDNAHIATTLPGAKKWQPTRAFESNSNIGEQP